MSDYDFDLGSFDDLAAVDLGGLENIDFGNLDFGNVDFGSNFDLGSFENLSAVDNLDLGSLGNMDFSSLDLGGLGNLNLSDIDVGGKFDYNQPLDQPINQRGLDSSFAGSGSSIFDGVNMTSNSDKLASIAQMARIISQGVPLGGGYIKPARFGPGYGFNWTRKFNGGGMVKRFAEGGYNFDLGSFDDLAAVDALRDIDLGGLDFGSNFDLGSFDDLASVDALNNVNFGSNFDLGSFEDIAAADLANIDLGSNFDLGSFEDLEAVDLGNRLAEFSQYNQDFGSSVDMGKAMEDFDTNLQGIYDKGGFTSQWQDVDGRKVQVYDDGTGMAVNPTTGASRSLSNAEVTSLIKGGKLNTAASGYNAATGGTKVAPGGGVSVTLKDGTTGTLLSNGRVVDNSGTVVGTDKDVKTTTTTTGDNTTKTGGGGGTTTRTNTPQGGLGSLLPLLLALLAMNKGGGGGGESRGAVIPGLTATQRQTPYAQQQRAPGYRPGQGGITYFDQTQYAPRMAAGGGIARLLDGPGDGVSDSIPAVIEDEGMAGGGQPAKLARGEYVIDARTVAALGNGSTDAGAERLDKMRKNILRDDRKAGVGKDSKAHRHLLA